MLARKGGKGCDYETVTMVEGRLDSRGQDQGHKVNVWPSAFGVL